MSVSALWTTHPRPCQTTPPSHPPGCLPPLPLLPGSCSIDNFWDLPDPHGQWPVLCEIPEQTWLAQNGLGLAHLCSPHSLTLDMSKRLLPRALIVSAPKPRREPPFWFPCQERSGFSPLPESALVSPRGPCCPASWPRAPAPCYHRLLCCHLLLRNLLKFSESPRRLSCSTTARLQEPRAGTTKQPQRIGDFCSVLRRAPPLSSPPGKVCQASLSLLPSPFSFSSSSYPFPSTSPSSISFSLSLSSSSTFSSSSSLNLDSEGCRASPSCWGWVCRRLVGVVGVQGS